MRVGLAISLGLHAALIGGAVLTLSQPEAFDVRDVESLPVELVEIGEITQTQEGAQDAPQDGPAAPEPVERAVPEPEAVNIGDNERDQATPETQEQLPAPVEEVRLPEPAEPPPPTPSEDRPREIVPVDPVEELIEAEPRPVPFPQPSPAPQPEPEPQQAAEPEPAAAPERVVLPDTLPVPTARPSRSQVPLQESRNQEEPRPIDEVASLLNRDRGSGGGAASNEQTASVGARRTTGGTTLTQSEMDALRGQIQSCWNVPSGVTDADQLRVSIRFNLDRNGRVEGRPAVIDSSGNRAADDSAMRAIMICNNRFDGFNLPQDKYEAWQQVVVNFDPSEMF